MEIIEKNLEKQNLIIFGIGYFADQIFRYLCLEGKTVEAFTVEKKYCDKKCFHDLPVIPFEELENHFSKNNISILVCIGYNKMNQVRKRVFDRIKDKGYKILSYTHPNATVLTDKLELGNIILENVSIGIGCFVGEGNIFYNNSVICHDVIIHNYNYFSPSSTILGGAQIKNGCFLGGNSTIKNGITIEDNSLIGANAFVRRDTRKKEVIVPANSITLDYDSFLLAEKLM